jgi:Lar family restriction alleviation protein
MADELKPCPFCGNEDVREEITLSYVEIWCPKCQATMMRGIMGKCDCLEDARKEIEPRTIKAWNRRATDGE